MPSFQIIDSKHVNLLFDRGQGKRRELKNEGMSTEVIENTWRKNVRFLL
jgi:hypothetical protein